MGDYFDIDAYLLQLKQSESILTCEPVPLPKIDKDQNYIFISYSHQDYKKVYADLAIMRQDGVRFWYDHGLPAGHDWDVEAKRRLEDPRCVGVIFFLSENLFLSQSVNQEIILVKGNKKQLKNYFCVNLTEHLPSRILRNVMRMDDLVLDVAGMDMDRIGVLANAFGDKMTYLRFSEPNHRQTLVEHIGRQFGVVEKPQQKRCYLLDKKRNQKIPITEENFFVGRSIRKCHLCVDYDPSVSLVHFSVSVHQNKNMIMDVGTTNGTYVNGKKIKSMMQIQLHDRDEISFGNQKFEFHDT